MKKEINWKYPICIFAFFLFIFIGITIIFSLHGYNFKTLKTFPDDENGNISSKNSFDKRIFGGTFFNLVIPGI